MNKNNSATIDEEEESRGRFNPNASLSQTTSILSKTTSRSTSRGRPAISMGRGGAGNLVQAVSSGQEDESIVKAARERNKSRSQSRGREEQVPVGRGGRGNLISPTRESGKTEEQIRIIEQEKEREQAVLAAAKVKQETRVFSTGRGGAGNIKR
ncbi:hypothetical protein T439DRAFT_327272 [Meredithblackwellia eburnea MCA 4105]